MELQPLYSADEMRELEARAIEGLRLPALVLMERAGGAAAAEIIRRYPGPTLPRSCVVRATTAATGSSWLGICTPPVGRSRCSSPASPAS